MTVTVNFEGEWDAALDYWRAVYAQREGGERPTPRTSRLIRCPKCNGVRHNLGGPHAPIHHRDGTMRDCKGDPC